MIDKKALLLIGVLAVVAILVLAVGFIAPSMGKPSGSSFSALFDKMVEKTKWDRDLVLPNTTYTAGQNIVVTDKIIAMSLNAQTTTLYFLYQGTTWAEETNGSSFDVLTDADPISVRGATFHIHLGTDLSYAFNVGDYITVQVQTKSSNGNIILGHNWALADI